MSFTGWGGPSGQSRYPRQGSGLQNREEFQTWLIFYLRHLFASTDQQ
jgi:hypothetical protein